MTYFVLKYLYTIIKWFFLFLLVCFLWIHIYSMSNWMQLYICLWDNAAIFTAAQQGEGSAGEINWSSQKPNFFIHTMILLIYFFLLTVIIVIFFNRPNLFSELGLKLLEWTHIFTTCSESPNQYIPPENYA